MGTPLARPYSDLGFGRRKLTEFKHTRKPETLKPGL
jgi:hypothetical protein